MNRLKVTFLAGVALAATSTTHATTIWAPMWDIRNLPMTWEVKAESSTLKVNSYFADGGRFLVTTSDGLSVLSDRSGSGDVTSGNLAVTPGAIYKVQYVSGFHVRPNFEGAQWARLGVGAQGTGPGSALGFQSDAELGFDDRWNSLPSRFADTTWSLNVAKGEHVSISVEEVNGDPTGASKFEWISPSGVKTVADSNGLPGSGGFHWPARSGNINASPDPASANFSQYTSPTDEAGWWSFKLTAKDGHLDPYAWHYILDRTDAGADQYLYLREGAILDPNSSVPDGGATSLMLLVSGVTLFAVRRK